MRHQDTEKGEGMFSTLVIQLQLPSHYRSGKFITERSSREAVPYYVLLIGPGYLRLLSCDHFLSPRYCLQNNFHVIVWSWEKEAWQSKRSWQGS